MFLPPIPISSYCFPNQKRILPDEANRFGLVSQFVITLIFVSSASAGGLYTVTDLGAYNLGIGVNNSGQVAGFNTSTGRDGFLSAPGGGVLNPLDALAAGGRNYV